jgi:lactate dehydrogenase-like 2-hydroxyacid dehydrogenase
METKNASKDMPKVYLASPVFIEIAKNLKVSSEKKKQILELWDQLNLIAEVKVSDERFPSEDEIRGAMIDWRANFVGCHLSHPITKEMQTNPDLYAVCTSTAGYNHIQLTDNVLYTNTPGVLHRTVADFTLSIILANLRNTINLHNFVWENKWKPGQKWDLDENLSMTMDNLHVGLVGLGEIGKEIVKRIAPWGIKITYYDIKRSTEFEKSYPSIKFEPDIKEIFTNCDIVSLHIPLVETTKHSINKDLLKLMKPYSLLVNTARGGILKTEDLLQLLESGESKINLALDVYENEPLDEETLNRFKNVANNDPELRFVFIPHNASADADTRAEMDIMILSDLIDLVKSKGLKDIENIRLIPEQRSLLQKENADKIVKFRINNYWKQS